MTNVGIDILLNELRSSAAQVSPPLPAAADAAQSGSASGTDFATLLTDAIASVSSAQNRAASLQDRLGVDPSVALQDVVVELSKASLSFQMMVQVRDRMVSAYRDVMNMQV